MRAALANVFLAVQGVGGEQGAAHAELLDQGPGGRDLVRRVADLPVRQDQGGLAGEGAQHVRGGLIVQVVEAAPERLAVERDHARPGGRHLPGQPPGMLAEGGLQRGRLEGQEEVAQRVHGRRAPKARPEGGVQTLAMHADEGQDAPVGGGAGQHRQDREEEQVGQRVTLALGPTRVGDRPERGEQGGERDHGSLRGKAAISTPAPHHRCLTSPRSPRLPPDLGTEQPCRSAAQEPHEGA